MANWAKVRLATSRKTNPPGDSVNFCRHIKVNVGLQRPIDIGGKAVSHQLSAKRFGDGVGASSRKHGACITLAGLLH